MAGKEPGLAAVFSSLCPSSPSPKRTRLPWVNILGGLFHSAEYCASAQVSSPEWFFVSISASSKCWEGQPREEVGCRYGVVGKCSLFSLYCKNKKLPHILFSLWEPLNSSRAFLTLLLFLSASFYLLTNSEIHGQIYRIGSFFKFGLS